MSVLTLVIMLPIMAQRKTAVLGIGNSFTEDLFWRVPELLDKDTMLVDLNILVIKGGSLKDHASLMKNDKADYLLMHFDNSTGEWTKDTACYSAVIMAREWDVISLQECSQLSGNYSFISQYLPSVLDRLQHDCPFASIYWHFTWAYPIGSNHPGLANYDYSQQKMYHDILAVSEKVMRGRFQDCIAGLIPTGAVIQNLRDSTQIITEHDFCRDDLHLDLTIARYAAACTFYQAVLAPRIGSSILERYNHPDDTSHSDADYQQIREIVARIVGNNRLLWSRLGNEHIYKTLFYEIHGIGLGYTPKRRPYIRQDFYESGRKCGNVLIKTGT